MSNLPPISCCEEKVTVYTLNSLDPYMTDVINDISPKGRKCLATSLCHPIIFHLLSCFALVVFL